MENNTNHIFDKLDIPYDVIAITSFLSTGIYVFLYNILIEKESFSLQSFSERVIGLGVIEGVDTVARTHFYLYSLITTCIFAVILLIWLEKGLNRFFPKIKYGNDRLVLALISLFGTSNFIFGVITTNTVFLFNIYMISTIFCCMVVFILAKRYADIKLNPSFKLFEDSAFNISLFLIPVPFLFVIQVIEGDVFAFTLMSFLLYFLIISFLLLFLVFINPLKNPHIIDEKFCGAVTTSIVPLYFYPLSIPLTNEIQYTLSQWISLDPRLLSFIVFLILLVSCIFYFIIQTQKNLAIKPIWAINNISFPIILAAFSIFSNYISGVATTIPNYGKNLFEYGLSSLVLQQFLDYGKIPFINIISPHGFMDQYYAILYSFINGFQTFDSFTWYWITPILVVLIGYFFFKELTDDGLLSFLIIIFLPVYGILYSEWFFILLGGIFFVRFWKDPQLKSYLCLLFTLLVCFIWRTECGVAATLAFLLIAAVLYFKNLKKHPKDLWKDYSKYFYCTVCVGIICGLLYLILCFITQQSPTGAIQSLIQLYMINDPIGTYPDLFTTYDAKVALQYMVFPFFGILLISIFIWISLTRKELLNSTILLIAFISIASLFLSQRGIQRHSLMEGFSYYYFPLIACSLPLIWYRSKKLISICLVIIIFFAGFFIAQYPFITVQKDMTNNFFEFNAWNNHENRIELHDSDYQEISDLSNYLSDHLKQNETYFDNSNFAMPHVLLRDECLSTSLINMMQAGEWYQNDMIQKLILNKDRIPIVVSGGWQVDGIPNEIRTYRISEYIYQNYRPIGKIDNYFEIWLRNDLRAIDDIDQYKTSLKSDELNSYNVLYNRTSEEVTIYSGSNDPSVWNFIPDELNNDQIESENTVFHMIYNSDTSGIIQIFYSINNLPFSEENSVVGTISKENDGDLYITIPENITNITNIRIDPPDDSILVIKDVCLYPVNILLSSDTTIHRDFNLKKLPYIWGNYDEQDPALNQPVQNVLFEGESSVTPGDPVIFTNISTHLDKSSGNYVLIQLKSEESGQIELKYGNGEKEGIIKLDVVPSDLEENYLIRVSSQWEWYSENITYVSITPSVPITLYTSKILKGD